MFDRDRTLVFLPSPQLPVSQMKLPGTDGGRGLEERPARSQPSGRRWRTRAGQDAEEFVCLLSDWNPAAGRALASAG